MNTYISLAVLGALLVCMMAVNGQRQARCCEAYCYELDKERGQAAHFGSKTAYEIIRGTQSGRLNDTKYLVPNCSPNKIWLYARHGTRLPSVKEQESLRALDQLRDEILDNYYKRHSMPDYGAMCEKDLNLLRGWQWNPNITNEYADFLTTEGWKELKFLAMRLQRSFPALMQPNYEQRNFYFQYTKYQRAEASFKAFAEGLFGEGVNEDIQVPQPTLNDTLLRPYETCQSFHQYKEKAPGSEYSKFLETSTMQQLVQDVSERLGYKFPLEVKQVLAMFEMCRFDQAWQLDEPSPWCVAFTPRQINDLEYLEDLEKFYKNSYGRKLNSHLSCSAVQDLLHHFDSNKGPKTIAYFTHSRAILMLLTALRMARDSDTLRAENYYSMQHRSWRVSDLTPFASNIMAIRYNCPNEVEHEKVMFFLNEKPVHFKWCKVGLCNWSDVKDQYKEYLNVDCQDYYCSSSAEMARYSSILVLVIPLITAFASILFVA